MVTCGLPDINAGMGGDTHGLRGPLGSPARPRYGLGGPLLGLGEVMIGVSLWTGGNVRLNYSALTSHTYEPFATRSDPVLYKL